MGQAHPAPGSAEEAIREIQALEADASEHFANDQLWEAAELYQAVSSKAGKFCATYPTSVLVPQVRAMRMLAEKRLGVIIGKLPTPGAPLERIQETNPVLAARVRKRLRHIRTVAPVKIWER